MRVDDGFDDEDSKSLDRPPPVLACPDCENAKRKQYLFSHRELEKYREHLRVIHGMYP